MSLQLDKQVHDFTKMYKTLLIRTTFYKTVHNSYKAIATFTKLYKIAQNYTSTTVRKPYQTLHNATQFYNNLDNSTTLLQNCTILYNPFKTNTYLHFYKTIKQTIQTFLNTLRTFTKLLQNCFKTLQNSTKFHTLFKRNRTSTKLYKTIQNFTELYKTHTTQQHLT